MKKLLFLLPLLLTACATTKVLNRYDTGEVQMTGRYKNHVLKGEVLSYYKNGQLWKRENYKQGELDGLREYYYEDYVSEADGTYRPVGQLETRSTYEMGYQVGKEDSFYRNGQLCTEQFYAKEPTVWREWYESGALKFEGDYVNGDGHGKWTYYYEDGTISKVMNLVDGQQQDQEDQQTEALPELYMPDNPHDSLMRERGRLQEAINDAFMSGDTKKMNRAEEAYDLFMEEHEEDFLDFIITMFAEQQRDGEFKEYYATGEVKLITPRSKGETHGEMRVFYKDGAVARIVEYKHNEEDGPVRSFYRDGEPEVEGQMTKGNRTGVWRFYNADGSLREEIDYSKQK